MINRCALVRPKGIGEDDPDIAETAKTLQVGQPELFFIEIRMC